MHTTVTLSAEYFPKKVLQCLGNLKFLRQGGSENGTQTKQGKIKIIGKIHLKFI